MRPLAPAASASHRITVRQSDVPEFGNAGVHDVYGTAAMVRDMERAARLLLEPLLEPGEDGVGAEVWCRHLAPVPVGASVEVVATATEQTRRRLVCQVEARHDGRLVGEGTVTQVIVDPARFGTNQPSDEGAS
ncbi:MAG TPA: hotdog domain-containing protein [Actinomycetes bacterium]